MECREHYKQKSCLGRLASKQKPAHPQSLGNLVKGRSRKESLGSLWANAWENRYGWMRKTTEVLHGHNSVLPSTAIGRLAFLSMHPLLFASLVVLLPQVDNKVIAFGMLIHKWTLPYRVPNLQSHLTKHHNEMLLRTMLNLEWVVTSEIQNHRWATSSCRPQGVGMHQGATCVSPSDDEENPNGEKDTPGAFTSRDKLSAVILQDLQGIGSRTFSGDT